MVTVAVIVALIGGPLAACLIAAVKGRRVVGWGAATLVVPLFFAGLGGWGYVTAVAVLVALVALLPPKGLRATGGLAPDGTRLPGRAERRRLRRLGRRLRRSRAGEPRHAEAARELAALDSGPAARVLLDYARERQAPPADEAWAAVAGMGGQEAVDEICRVWDGDPSPALEELVRSRALLASRPARLTLASGLLCGSPPAAVPGDRVALLAELLGHGSAAVRQGARSALLSLKAAADVDRLCALAFSEPPARELWDIVAEARFVATAPTAVRLQSAVLGGRLPEVVGRDAGALAELIRLRGASADERFRGLALEALRGLEAPEQTDLFCDLAIAQAPDGEATALCLTLGLVPSAPARRAVLYVLTAQLALYDGLDPDGTLLQTGYGDLGAAVAAQVRQALIHAGRASLLTQVLTRDRTPAELKYDAGEAGFVVGQLAERGDWRQLASLLPALPVPDALRAARALDVAALPTDETGRLDDVAGLCALARRETLTPAELADGRVPALFRVAGLNVSARINDLVFSPDEHHVAIALGARRAVVQWDHASGTTAGVVRGFGHSVGRVAYGGDGRLYCAEKTSTTTGSCGVYVVDDAGEPAALGTHTGSVTSLCPLDRGRLATTGRDELLKVWPGGDAAAVRLPSWARQACVLTLDGGAGAPEDGPGGDAHGSGAGGGATGSGAGRPAAIAVAADDLLLVDPDGGATLATVPLRGSGRVTALSPAPAGAAGDPDAARGALVLGTTAGAVLRVDVEGRPAAAPAAGPPLALTCTLAQVRRAPDAADAWERVGAPPGADSPAGADAPAPAAGGDAPKRAAVAGLEWLDARTLCVAWADGRIELLSWPDGRSEWTAVLDVERVTSAAATPDGRLLALGDGDARSLLFDTSGRRLRGILRRPANACSPRDWACVRGLRAAPDLPPVLANTLAFADRLLENRFRHDVQLADEAPAVVHGEFDIAIDVEEG